ncbi:efflux RND transporter periplasmic adaptor subunit (plasmid) [Bradyrhizobium sp. SK17]|jgi:membrane fusion protein (multidrug efflux system)|uniref:Efflux RND transporter periplasmic adaptor subunit n=1 Tax=Bradyrhizobium betae TaxID=244734 RepID=A0A5P6PH16_9BRAD|nr:MULTISPECIES: efflux RND transporter periplasmic adaptor subunit [Bradyrhizobium]AUD00248.1 efflux RND transporter periplasmic adaptor subunit [Bradyrhizobium sp. SK17]MCS3730901.1 membrane fusion protein (multidrug efflux system) [Bradyrhizobium betae]QFI77580.1 efflux RND transporter periplasmic adaptor subunit [Bradyrhizobium betae]
MSPILRLIAIASTFLAVPVSAQTGAGGPPMVGVVTVESKAITEATEINGRIQAIGRVDLSARVTAFLDEKLFVEGAEVSKGDLLFRLERAPFEADVEGKRAAVAQAQAQLENANLALDRAEQLLKSSSGSQSSADNARAAQKTAAAQLRSAQAQLRQSEISLGYTEIRSPIDGRVGRTAFTIGNVVGPASGALATIVSQDPIYVSFPISVARFLELRERFATDGGSNAVRIRLRLPDGRLYGQVGKLNFIDINVARDTDTIVLRAIVPNPALPGRGGRELVNDELVRVVLESVKPRDVVAIPRAAVLTDQQGDFVYVVGEKDIAQQRRIKLGQSTATTAAIIEGLQVGERVIAEGIQRVRPNTPVAPAPVEALSPPSKPAQRG